MFSLPAAPNSGQYVVTGASRSRRPSCARRWAQIAVAPFVVEKTRVSVSSAQGRSVAGSAMPPQRSTTFSPRW